MAAITKDGKCSDCGSVLGARCENCKHWQRILGWEGGKCSMMSETGDGLSPNACIIFRVGCAGRAVLHNREPWVHTMPDFGCTLFEKKGGE